MRKQLRKLCQELSIELWWSDELPRAAKRDGWVGVSDVAVNLRRGAVAVCRRRFGAYHVAEVLHEVAHLETWRKSNRTPTHHNEVEVCRLALLLGGTHNFERAVLEHLERDLARQLEA